MIVQRPTYVTLVRLLIETDWLEAARERRGEIAHNPAARILDGEVVRVRVTSDDAAAFLCWASTLPGTPTVREGD